MFVSVGLNQRGAPLSLRELLVELAPKVEDLLPTLAALDGVDEVAVLASPHRLEVFAATGCPAAAGPEVRRALRDLAGRDLPLHELHGDEAFRHLVRVVSGLELPALDEPEVPGQVREAFQHARDAGAAGRELTTIVGRALAIGQRVRDETALGRAGPSWSHAVAALAEKVLGPLADLRVAMVGAGEAGRACARLLHERGAAIAVVERTLASGEALAREVEGTASAPDDLEAELASADVVVCADPVAPQAFSPGAVARRARKRRRRTVVVDLAVPRAIPEESGAVEDVYLCDVADLDRVMSATLTERAGTIGRAEAIVEEEISRAKGQPLVAAAVALSGIEKGAPTQRINAP